jgi:type IV secretion system protein VirD4
MYASQVITLIVAGMTMFGVIGFLSLLAHYYTLNGIKSKTVGDGQHGTAKFASKSEIQQTYEQVPYQPDLWRQGKNLPSVQGLILGCKTAGDSVTALVDSGDIHCLMISAASVGKTAYFLYPNLEYACASGMSFLTTDTKGDLFRNYATIAQKYYGYNVSVIDLRNPTRSDGNNMLHLVNQYMDTYLRDPEISRTRPEPRNTPRLPQKHSAVPEDWTQAITAKTPSFTMPPRAS